LIVVDDGSTDDTPQLVASFGDRVSYLRKTNGGKSSALNLGLTHAIGDLIWVFDDDDVAQPTALSHFVRALEENPEAGFAYGNYAHFTNSADGVRHLRASTFHTPARTDLYLTLLENCFIFQPGMLVRRACYDSVGLFDENLIRSQDYEMLLRIARKFPGVAVEAITFHQRHHDSPRGTLQMVVSDAQKKATWQRYDQSAPRTRRPGTSGA
jgi:glycosyltransferase involved in cell wall biosynthesis